MVKDLKRNTQVVYTAEEVIQHVEAARSNIDAINYKIHLFTKDSTGLGVLRWSEDVELHEPGGLWNRIMSVLTGVSPIEAGLRNLQLSEEEIRTYNAALQNGGFVIVQQHDGMDEAIPTDASTQDSQPLSGVAGMHGAADEAFNHQESADELMKFASTSEAYEDYIRAEKRHHSQDLLHDEKIHFTHGEVSYDREDIPSDTLEKAFRMDEEYDDNKLYVSDDMYEEALVMNAAFDADAEAMAHEFMYGGEPSIDMDELYDEALAMNAEYDEELRQEQVALGGMLDEQATLYMADVTTNEPDVEALHAKALVINEQFNEAHATNVTELHLSSIEKPQLWNENGDPMSLYDNKKAERNIASQPLVENPETGEPMPAELASEQDKFITNETKLSFVVHDSGHHFMMDVEGAMHEEDGAMRMDHEGPQSYLADAHSLEIAQEQNEDYIANFSRVAGDDDTSQVATIDELSVTTSFILEAEGATHEVEGEVRIDDEGLQSFFADDHNVEIASNDGQDVLSNISNDEDKPASKRNGMLTGIRGAESDHIIDIMGAHVEGVYEHIKYFNPVQDMDTSDVANSYNEVENFANVASDEGSFNDNLTETNLQTEEAISASKRNGMFTGIRGAESDHIADIMGAHVEGVYEHIKHFNPAQDMGEAPFITQEDDPQMVAMSDDDGPVEYATNYNPPKDESLVDGGGVYKQQKLFNDGANTESANVIQDMHGITHEQEGERRMDDEGPQSYLVEDL